MDRLFIVALFALAWIQKINGVQIVFHQPTIEMVEASGIAMQYTIGLSRTGDELPGVPRVTTLTTNCPAGVTATASTSDYSLATLDVTFPVGESNTDIMVTISDDDDYEPGEIFCLSIPDDVAGSQKTITVTIPENDNCIERSVPGVTSATFAIAMAEYVGPWLPTMSDTVEIEVTTEMGGSGDDIAIFLAETADQGTPADYYTIVFDYSMASTTGDSANDGDTVVYDGVVDPTGSALLIPASAAEHFFEPGVAKSVWLRYDSGSISVGLPGTTTPIETPVMLATHSVKHIFVMGGVTGESATFKVCSPGIPRKLQPVQAVQYMDEGNPDRAIDGGIGPLVTSNQCFVTSTGTNPWLRIDLGKVYEVTNVLIWPVTADTDFPFAAKPSDIDNAKVYVGDCPSDQITDNIECFDVAGTGANGDDPIEGCCTLRGRYVYIYKTGSTQFSFCEVEIYGKEVPYGEEATVQFEEAEYEVNEDVGTYMINAIRTYPSGVLPTCTSADYYTDRIVTPASGNSNDFDPIPANPPTDANPSFDPPWVPGDITGTMKPIVITIHNSPGVCEPIETFNVYLTNIVGGIAGTPTSTTIKIKDTDVINYSFSMASYSMTEGTPFSIDVTRTGNAAMQQGTAGLIFADVTTTANDYTTPTTSVSFNTNSGQTEPVAVLTTDDNIYELTESLTVGLGALTPNENMCSMMGSVGMATLMITDNDSRFWFDVDPGVTIVIPEGQSRTIDILREGTVLQKNVEIIISEGGTPDLAAVLGNDFTITPTPSAGVSTVTFESTINKQAITITTENDSNLERAETFTLTLRDPLYPDGNRGDPFSLSISIVDNDAEYFWKQNSYSVTEGDASVIVCVLRTGEPVAKSIVITTVAVSALVGPDFEPIQRIMFEENEFEACAPVTIAVDTATESTETFMMKITSEQDVVTNPMSDTTTVSILDDDTIISFSPATYNFREGQSGLSVMISKTGNPSVSFTLTITSGTATQNNDFILNVASSSPLTIPTGTTSLTLPITIIDDVLVEQAEQFTLTISGASGGTITTPTATITITDNDVATPIPPITTPTTTADSGIGGAAIAAIAVSAAIGAIITIIAIVIFCVMLSGANAAASATAGASATAAANSFPLTNYPPGYNNAINGLDNGFGGTRTSYNPYYM